MTTRTRQSPSGSPSRVSRNQILQAARLLYDHGMKQGDIAEQMGISQSYLARLLDRARSLGWVRIYVDADRNTELAAAIRERYPVLRRVEVVPVSADASTTALAVATCMANWLNETLDRDEERDAPTLRRIAIGGSWPMRLMLDQLDPRPNRLHICPTALTPQLGRQDRFTAPMLATLLAFRFGALGPANVRPPGSDAGHLYSGTFDQGDFRSLGDLQAALRAFESRPAFAEIREFWEHADIAFISCVRADGPYPDVQRRLGLLGLDPADVLRAGRALVANRVLDQTGAEVQLGPDTPTYEPVFPTPVLRRMVAEDVPHQRHVVLEAWGEARPRGAAGPARRTRERACVRRDRGGGPGRRGWIGLSTGRFLVRRSLVECGYLAAPRPRRWSGANLSASSMRNRETPPFLRLVKPEPEVGERTEAQEHKRATMNVISKFLVEASNNFGRIGMIEFGKGIPKELGLGHAAWDHRQRTFELAKELRAQLGISDEEWQEFLDEG